MKPNPILSRMLSPRLSMDEYVIFLDAALKAINPRQALRQKALEERIRIPFSFPEEVGWKARE